MDLKELLGEELYNQIVTKAGEHKIAIVSDGSFFPKDKFDTVNNDNKELKTQLKDRDTQLEELGKKAKGNEELEKQINELKESNKTTASEYQSKLDKQAFDFALEKAITGAQAKNPRAVKALLDLEKIKMDGEKLLGFDDQLTVLKTSDGYLFGEAEKLGGRKPNDTMAPPGSQTANLQAEYEKAVSGGNMPLAISIKNRIFRGEEQGE
jgi:hypothetical protein